MKILKFLVIGLLLVWALIYFVPVFLGLISGQGFSFPNTVNPLKLLSGDYLQS